MSLHLFLAWCQLEIASDMMNNHFPSHLFVMHLMVYSDTCWWNGWSCDISHMFFCQSGIVLVSAFSDAFTAQNLTRLVVWYWDVGFLFFSPPLYITAKIDVCSFKFLNWFVLTSVARHLSITFFNVKSESQSNNLWLSFFKIPHTILFLSHFGACQIHSS